MISSYSNIPVKFTQNYEKIWIQLLQQILVFTANQTWQLVIKIIISKENVRYPVWTCRDPIFLILGTQFSLILGTRIGSLKHLIKTCENVKHETLCC